MLILSAVGQKEGESCVEQYTYTTGVCTQVQQCISAKNDFQQAGIRPTFCSYSTFGAAVVCCRDGSNILQRASNRNSDTRPVWGSANDRRRVSERKCDIYSRGVTNRVQYMPLLPEPETFSILTPKCDYTGIELIIGGENAKLGEFPHMAAIGWVNFNDEYSFSCGGSLISTRFVVTAGHCTRDPNAKQPEPVIVRLGDKNIDNSVRDGADPIDVPIRRIHKYPDYKPPIVYHDIALIELASDVSFTSSIRAACLWGKPNFPGYDKVVATGWGVTDTATGEKSNELKKVDLSLLENDYCDSLLYSIRNRKWQGMAESQMCAGELRGGKDTCQGDSGSPLQVVSKENQCVFHIVGVTSFGRHCGEKDRQIGRAHV